MRDRVQQKNHNVAYDDDETEDRDLPVLVLVVILVVVLSAFAMIAQSGKLDAAWMNATERSPTELNRLDAFQGAPDTVLVPEHTHQNTN